jgi:hypothetical protein
MNNVTKIFFQLIKAKETLINIKIEIKGILMSSVKGARKRDKDNGQLLVHGRRTEP